MSSAPDLPLGLWLDRYTAAGFAVFPCHAVAVAPETGELVCTCPRPGCKNQGKHPRTRTGVKEATKRIEMVRRWHSAFGDLMNPAIATGAVSGILVIDVDPRDGGAESWAQLQEEHAIRPTLTQSTGGGGQHYVFRYPPGLRIRNWVGFREGIDVRSDGGYVIGAPADHISGDVYRWQNWGARPVEMPASLVDALARPQVGSRRIGDGSSRQSEPLPAFETFLGRGLPVGARNDTMLRLACSWWRTLGLHADAEVERRAWAVWEATASHDSFPWEEAQKAVESARRFIESDDAKAREFLRSMGRRRHGR